MFDPFFEAFETKYTKQIATHFDNLNYTRHLAPGGSSLGECNTRECVPVHECDPSASLAGGPIEPSNRYL